MPMWMWVNRSATTYGPNTASASASGVSVTATAKVTKIVWAMGDGTTVTVPRARHSVHSGCGQVDLTHLRAHLHADLRRSARGRYRVTATSTWAIDWQVTTGGGGQTGQLTETRQTQTQVPLQELQVLN
ncbi:ATP/GTP-binding protein [Streptomyces fructofermentans]|uniref:ATP/GTP-binding protein n=1 Tax=Streptomyces fructofermentans TaxID=152141 RepID=UPI0037928CF2